VIVLSTTLIFIRVGCVAYSGKNVPPFKKGAAENLIQQVQ